MAKRKEEYPVARFIAGMFFRLSDKDWDRMQEDPEFTMTVARDWSAGAIAGLTLGFCIAYWLGIYDLLLGR